jgi:hypothetical protein
MRLHTSVAAVAGLALALTAAGQTVKNQINQSIDRGKAVPAPNDRGKFHTERGLAPAASSFHGVLLDGSCAELATLNLRDTPMRQPAVTPQGTANRSKLEAKGATIERERADAMAQQVRDQYGRQPDLSCAVTAGTSGFAVLLDNGRLVDLDSGGAMHALEALRSSSQGRAMLDGSGPALKPRVQLSGWVSGTRLITQSVKLQ